MSYVRNDASEVFPSFSDAFWNQVNMIYLGTITDRVPIIPPFAPDHHICECLVVLVFEELLTILSQIQHPPQELFHSETCLISNIYVKFFAFPFSNGAM